MKITPLDINHRTFSRRMFGIDENEVAEFLQTIAGQLEALIYERNVLRESLREKEMQIGDLRERDQVLKNTITAASQMAEKMKLDSEREAKLIVADAQQKAECLTRDSRDSLRKVYQDLGDLKRARMQFEANLKAMAQAHLSLLEQSEKFMPNIGIPNIGMPHNQFVEQHPPQRSSEISPLSAIR